MKILYLSNRVAVNKNEAATWFQLYCEPMDLYLFKNISDTKKFLLQKIIGQQKHLDLIITDWKFNSQNAKELLNWIRESDADYSSSNFKFRSLPVLLIEDISNQSPSISEGFNGLIKDFLSNDLNLKLTIQSAIKTWRYSLAEDLELIGLDPQTLKNYPRQRKDFISYFRIKVLSRGFIDKKSKKLNYIWTLPHPALVTNANQLFFDKITSTRRHPPKYLEKEFHNFFLQFPTLIKGEDFQFAGDAMLYEKHLYKDGRKYDEPDFMNRPYDYSLRNPEILEIKRHTQRLLRLKQEKFMSKARKSFEQVKRYQKYVYSKNPLHQFYIERYFGKIYCTFEFSLLMGSYEEKVENEDILLKLKMEFDFNEINLITYEELLERHIRLCDRLNDYNIFT